MQEHDFGVGQTPDVRLLTRQEFGEPLLHFIGVGPIDTSSEYCIELDVDLE